MKRKRMKMKKSKKLFSNTAKRIHKKNLSGSIARGGIRL